MYKKSSRCFIRLVAVALLAAVLASCVVLVSAATVGEKNAVGAKQSIFQTIFSWVFRSKTKIDLADYPAPGIDYGTLNAQQRVAMDNILAACEAGKDTAEIPALTQAEFDEVTMHIGMHFGADFRFGNETVYKGIASRQAASTEVRYWAKVNLDTYERAKTHKEELDARVDAALSTLYEGTTEYKLEQICKWIARNGKYKYGTNDPLYLLNKGGMCGAYAMLFYKMATRLGVDAYICYGYATNRAGKTAAHAWNMVSVDGVSYYYDPTWYDSNRMSKYMHSKTAWGREYELNSKAALTHNGSQRDNPIA